MTGTFFYKESFTGGESTVYTRTILRATNSLACDPR